MIAAISVAARLVSAQTSTPEYGYRVVHSYPHDPLAFTEGLFYLDGFLYESTGLKGASSIRKVKIETGEVVQKYDLPANYFGEGIIIWKDRMIQLTWQSQIGFIHDLKTFRVTSTFYYPGEGWALTQDGKRIIMDDGTPQLRFWDPESLAELGRLTVTDHGMPVENLNELEWVKGQVYANIWGTNRIARIDPVNGRVVGWIDLTGLLKAEEVNADSDAVLNGIAYDAKHDRLFVTGKKWPKVFEIRLVKSSDLRAGRSGSRRVDRVRIGAQIPDGLLRGRRRSVPNERGARERYRQCGPHPLRRTGADVRDYRCARNLPCRAPSHARAARARLLDGVSST